MRLFHTPTVASAIFDEPNLVSAAGLVPVMALARRARLGELAQARVSVPRDMGVLRHGAMGKVIGGGHAPSTLGSFLRAFTFGHVRQLDAVASRFLRSLAAHVPRQALWQGPLVAGGDLLKESDDHVQSAGVPGRGEGP